MRLLASTDLALRIVMLLGRHRQTDDDAQMNVETIARQLGNLSRHHLHKIVQNLVALGVVQTVRGAHGGVMLTGRLADIHLGGFIRSLESAQALVDCFRDDGGTCVLKACCRLKGMLREAQEEFYNSLDRSTLADVIATGDATPGSPHRTADEKKPREEG